MTIVETPKEKAKELFDKYYEIAQSIEWTDNETKEKAEKFNDELGADVLKYWHELAKESALIAVYEILEVLYSLELGNALQEEIQYYEEVKQKLKKL